jgi:DNA-binding NarL/FixJ family response regulator
MTDYAAVLTRRHPGREWKLEGDDYAGLTMLDDGEKPSKKSLDDAWLEVQAEIAAEAAAKITARQSALAKLAALGLTDEEIAALVGA